jgi:adenylate cyclase
VRRVAEDLGVRYVLEGSVRRAGDHVRVNTQLIDATTGGHVWAERYDRRLDNIFAVQDAIAEQVVRALEPRLTSAEKERREEGPKTTSVEAYDLVLKARERMTRFDYDAAAEARDLLQRAIDLDPTYAEAYSLLGLYYFDEWRLWGRDGENNLSRALELAETAVELNPLDPAPHVLRAQVHQFRREFDAANEEADAAFALEPNDAITLANLGSMLRYAHRAEEAAEVVERAIRLDPYHPPNYLEWLSDAYFLLGRYEECIHAANRGVALDPDFVPMHVLLAECHAALGNEDKAREAASEILRANPHFTLKAFASYVPLSDKGDLRIKTEMLRRAGVPE